VPNSLGANMGPAECLSLADHSFRESINLLESMGNTVESENVARRLDAL